MLTKSAFRLGVSCPNKIFFKNNKDYTNQSLDDPFLKALATGGFQIEAYARKFYQTGVFIEDGYKDPLKAIEKTKNALKEDCILFYSILFYSRRLSVWMIYILLRILLSKRATGSKL